ncbi:arsenate reductase (glutaredoxin) [Erwinia sp. D4-22]
MTTTIYHNPKCGTSRNTLALIRNSGEEPNIIYYLETPPSQAELTTLLENMGIGARDLLRNNVEPYATLELAEDRFSDEQLIVFMVQYPLLINRPIVVTSLGARLCRPAEKVLDILPNPQRGMFAKENGEVIVDAMGKRVK